MGSANTPGYGAAAKEGARWAFLEVSVSGFVQAARIAVLARFFVSPDDFGFVALANSALALITAFAALGTVPYLVFRTDADRQLFSGIYWITALSGVLFCAAMIATAGLIATGLGHPALELPLQVLALTLVVDSIGNPIMAVYVRDFSFRRHALAETISTLAGTAVTFALAAWGQPIWALVLGAVFQRALRALIALWWGYELISLELRPREVRAFSKFSGYTIAERFAGAFNERVPYIFLGWHQSEGEVGIFAVTSNLIAVPLQYAMNVALQAVTPVFARLQKETGRLSDAYFLSLELVMSLVAPAFLGLMAIAPLLTPMLLGEAWAQAAPTLQYMCITFTIHAVYYFSSGLTLGTGRAQSAFALTALQAPGMLVVAYVGARLGGAETVAKGQVIVSAMTLVPYYLLVTRPILGKCSREFALSIAIPSGMALVMALAVMAIGVRLRSWPDEAALAVQVASGVLIYGALMVVFRPGIGREILKVLIPDRVRGLLRALCARWPGIAALLR